jgi:hypothetical protein
VGRERFPAKQARIVRFLVERVAVYETGAEVVMRSDGLHSIVGEVGIARPEEGSAALG